MRRALEAFLALFGVIVIGISVAHMAIGPNAIIGAIAVNPTMDGEDRFSAGVFLCLGIALLWCARDVQHKRTYVNFIAAAFFTGGIGRSPALPGPSSR
jgi:drug/metabolite transporter (DMT)-like permease